MTKIKIQIKNRLTDDVLFEYKKKDNTIKDTLLEAINERANLHWADLRGADLYEADLRRADLRGVNLRGADLRGANLREADLHWADLYAADLRRANLSGANLSGANLHWADLYAADLRGVDLREVKNVPYIPLACPSDGAFVGWTKIHGKLVKLEIPEDAKRSSATSNKCRCDKAKVLAITDYYGGNSIDEIENTAQEHHIIYKVGEMVYPDSFDEDRWNECSHGIHFFTNKQDAINY